jgi:ESCRT-I complex subunit TSG101
MYVDHNGKIYLPYLHDWQPSSSDLLGLIQVMIVTFGDYPPVYSKPKDTPYPTQSYMPQNQPSYMSPYPSSNFPAYPPASNFGGGYPGYPPASSGPTGYPPYMPPSMPMPGTGFNSTFVSILLRLPRPTQLIALSSRIPSKALAQLPRNT